MVRVITIAYVLFWVHATVPASALGGDTRQEVLEKLDLLLGKMEALEGRMEELEKRLDKVTYALIKKIDDSLATGPREGGRPDEANPLATVSGIITLDGQPLGDAIIVFTPASGGRPSGDLQGQHPPTIDPRRQTLSMSTY